MKLLEHMCQGKAFGEAELYTFEEKIVCEVEYVIDFQIWGSYNFRYGK